MWSMPIWGRPRRGWVGVEVVMASLVEESAKGPRSLGVLGRWGDLLCAPCGEWGVSSGWSDSGVSGK